MDLINVETFYGTMPIQNLSQVKDDSLKWRLNELIFLNGKIK